MKMKKETALTTRPTSKPGPKGKYETHVKPYLTEIFEWLKQGYTDISICDQLGISQDSWIKYREEHSELSELYTRARTERNRLVMNKMFQRACGEKVTLLKQKATKDGEIVDLVEEQYIPPDVNAADLFLRNNDPEYRSAKMDLNSLTLVQHNYNLDELEAKRLEILKELKRLESATDADFKVISDS